MSLHNIRIAKIPYLNSRPFFHGWLEDFQMISGSPRELGEVAERGEVDAGPLALVDFWRLSSLFEPLGPWGISSEGFSGSVILFSKRPLKDLAGCFIGISEETSTSAALLRILLESRYGIQANLRRGFAKSDDAHLIIGDEAFLRCQKREANHDFPLMIDLGEEWHSWRSLPFVFAQWVVRKDLPESSKKRIIGALESSLRQCRLQGLARAFAQKSRISEEHVFRYLSGFRYTFTKEEQKAMEAFHDLWTAKVPVCGC